MAGYAGPGPLERLTSSLSLDANGCWVHKRPHLNGYAYLQHQGKRVLGHRFIYAAMVADIPEGLQLDHLCRNRACCNPYHLEPVTPGVNSRRGARMGYRKAFCKHGHAKTPENTYVSPSGLRICRTCKRASYRREAVATR